MIESNNRRIAKNTLYLYLRMLLTMGVRLYTSRVVLNTLGVEDFGIYNIVGGVVVLFSFINGSLSSATQRFLNFELGRNDIQETKRVFSMSLTLYIYAAIIVILLAETIGLWFVNTQMNIPSERMNAANWVYQLSILTVCVSFVQVPYYASVVAYEKMSFFAYVAIIEVALRLLVVFLLVYAGFEKLKLYAVLTFLVAVAVFGCYKYYCNAKIDTSRYKYFWNKTLFSKLLNFSGWMLFGAAAGVSATQGVNILLNIFYGVTVNAAMGIANQVNSAVNQFVSNFQTAFIPQITKLYAQGDTEQLRQLIYRSSRFSFFLLFALACPLMLNMDFVLKLWLKTVPEYSSVFCILILIYSLIEAMSKPIAFAIHATGQVKSYNTVMSIALLMNIVFSYIFLKLGFQPSVVLIINVLVNILCFAIRLLLVRHFKVLKIRDFIRNVILRVLCIALLALPVPLYISKHYTQWTGLFASSLMFLSILAATVYFIGLTKSEKTTILRFAKNKMSVFRK
jgi:O-antigen/teichoic acid export membrane protein